MVISDASQAEEELENCRPVGLFGGFCELIVGVILLITGASVWKQV
jgi:hypothetical protein